MAEPGTCSELIRQLHTELEKNANNFLRQDELTISQMNVLALLSRDEHQRMELKQLERRLHVAQSTTAGLVKRLEQKGFVQTFISEQDHRVKYAQLTAAGLDCCRRAASGMNRAETELTAALTPTEREILLSLLQKVRDSFS